MRLAFRIADEEGLLLVDTKDLRALLNLLGEQPKEIKDKYGRIPSASLGAISRRLLRIEEADSKGYFGEPSLKIEHFFKTQLNGEGNINLLDVREIITDKTTYSMFLLWLLSELFEQLEEVGDVDKPKLVFFFDEAHLLFKNIQRELLDKIETLVKLIRSKGVSVFFITQSPRDIPESVLSQLGNKVQHALRSYTQKDREVIRAAARSFRENPEFETESVITELGTGEALVSTLGDDGVPGVVKRVMIVPPESQIGPLSDEQRKIAINRSPFAGLYDELVDRESAFEILEKKRQELKEKEAEEEAAEEAKPKGRKRQSAMEAFFKSMVRSVGYQIGRKIVRGILGSIRL